MRVLKKYWLYITGVAIILLFFFSRLYNLLALPIFTDEAIYVRWAQIAKDDAAWRFISLTDGKQPMFVWVGMIVMKFIDDPLFAGRFVSVIAGALSMVGMFFLTSEIFKNPLTQLRASKIGVLAAFLYVIFPFSLVYDRLALYDSLVSMFIIWSLYFEILLVRNVRLDIALILGMIVGGGMLTKTNANFALILLPFSLLLFQFKDKNKNVKLKKLFIFSLVTLFIAGAMYSILRLSPFYHIIGDKNYVFIYQPQEWIQHPFQYVIDNGRAMIDWLVRYATIPFLVLIAAAFFVSKKYTRAKILLLIWFIIPFVALAFFGKVIYPRFILFMTMPLIVLAAYTMYSLLISVRQVWFKAFILFVFTAMFFINDYYIITDFIKASIPHSDRGQFITGWPAGNGVKESIAILQEKSKNQKIYVGTEGTFGLMPYALEIYLKDNPNITIKGFWPVGDTPPEELIEASKKMPTYIIFYQFCPSCKVIGKAPISWPVKPIFQVKKQEVESYYTLYEFQSP